MRTWIGQRWVLGAMAMMGLCVAAVLGQVAKPAAGAGQTHGKDAEVGLEAMRKVRDDGDATALRAGIAAARAAAKNQNDAAAYTQVALLGLWLCEADHANNDEKAVKAAAEEGADAAKHAIQLDPRSSEAHRLRGELLGELIPHVLAGGMRYGRESTQETEQAISLDPKNPKAYIARGIDYFYAPSAFGGSHEKAVEMLKKAVSLDASSDTAHIWLARVYFADKKLDEATREIDEAVQLNPRRKFAQVVKEQMTGTRK